MRRLSALAAFTLVFVVAAPGQGSAGTTAVQDALDKKDWQRAIDLLEPLARRANSLSERDRLAGLFAHAGTALCAERNWQLALRAWRGSLELLQKVTRKDHQGVASSHMWVGECLTKLGKAADALPHFETACAMQRRLTDDAELIAKAFNNLGYCLEACARLDDAMARYVEGLECVGARAKERDRPEVAVLLHNLAGLKQKRSDFLAAARLFAEAIAMWQRLQCPADDPRLVLSRANYAHCLTRMAKTAEALPLFEAALVAARARRGSGDDAEVAEMLNNIAWCRDSEGDPAAALALFEQSLAMRQRLAAGTDEPGVAQSLQNSAHCLQQLGRVAVALGRYEEALAMRQRLGGQNASLEVARSLDGVGDCLRRLGSPALAVERHAAALTMWTRIHGARDVVEVAFCRASIAGCLLELGEAEEARGVSEAALAMLRRIHADRDHPDVAKAMNTTASALAALGQLPPALAQHEAALAMQQRLFRGRAHPEIAATQLAIAACQSAAGEHAKALAGASAALATNEACFGDVDQVAAVRCLTWIGACLQALDRAPAAIVRLEAARDMLERLADRNRALSDDLRKSLLDELKRGGTYERLQALLVAAGKPADALAVAERSRSRLLLETLTQCGIDPLAEATARAEARGDRTTTAALRGLRDELDAAQQEVDRLLHRLALQPVGADPGASAAVLADLRTQLTAATRKQQKALGRRARAVDGVLPAARPPSVAEIQRTLRPGELLLEYTVAPEASLLYVLAPDGDVQVFPLPGAAEAVDRLLPALVASLARASHSSARGRDPEPNVAAGDAAASAAGLFAHLVPAKAWALIREAARVFMVPHRALHRLPFEALVVDAVDGKPSRWLDRGPPVAYVPSGGVLLWLRQRPVAPTAGGLVAVGDPANATEPRAAVVGVRGGELARLRALPALRGARAEAEALMAAWTAKELPARLLLGGDATEAAVFEHARGSSHLHFACHGLAEQYSGLTLSTLVLTPPARPGPGDDGLLEVGELFTRWRGRLDGCRQVVLSACRTNVGPTGRDDAPHALPLGFLFAGAASVVSTAWAVDDASTRELMADYCGRLLTGEQDRLAALTAAKRALQQRYPDPFHWAPFLHLGVPE